MLQNLLAFDEYVEEDAGAIVAIVFVAIWFIVVFAITFFAVKSSKKQNSNNNATTSQPSPTTSVNQSYLNSLRDKKYAQQNNHASVAEQPKNDDDHEHVGKVENYDKIVGSLGEVSDEGCDELDGVRLIENDESYATDDGEIIYDYEKLAKSMILGEVLDNPRFKGKHKR